MKKINSIWYGEKVILIGSIFAFILPMCIRIIPLESIIFHKVCKISFVVGTVLLIGFSIWLIIELHQDKKINQYYKENINRKIKVGKNRYECQSCGNRYVKTFDKRCNICGINFKEQDLT